MLSDLMKGKTRLLWHGTIPAGTITIDTEEPLAGGDQPVWPEHKRHEPALYVRRVVVSRNYAGHGLGAGLLDWAGDMAKRDYGVTLIRVDVWTTNRNLHAYYVRQRFTRREGRDPRELANYPSQALFEREVNKSGSDYKRLFVEMDRPNEQVQHSNTVTSPTDSCTDPNLRRSPLAHALMRPS